MDDIKLERDIWHILVTGKVPEGEFRAANLSGDTAKRVQSIKQYLKDNYTIVSDERLKKLENSEEILYALEAAGVDNWEGYSIAMESLKEE